MAVTVAFSKRTSVVHFATNIEEQTHFPVAGASDFTWSDGKIKAWDSKQNIYLSSIRPEMVC